MSKWLEILKTLGPLLVAAMLPNGAVMAPAIIHGIEEAEALKGASGPEKLQLAVAIAVDAASVAQAAGAKVDPAQVQAAASSAISTAVSVINIVSRAKAAA